MSPKIKEWISFDIRFTSVRSGVVFCEKFRTNCIVAKNVDKSHAI